MIRYPWDKWLDGKGWELVRGTDFYVPAKSFQIIVCQAIARYGLAGDLGTRRSGDRVWIQPVREARGTSADV